MDRMCKILALRDAIREELDATNTYDKLMDIMPEFRAVLTEIKEDEINHTGRLMNLLFTLTPDEVEKFNKGMEQKE